MKWLVVIWLMLFVLLGWSQDDEPYEYSAEYWVPHYDFNSLEPYGGYMLSSLLIDRFSDYRYVSVLKEDLPEERDFNALYVTYSYDMHWRESDYEALMTFIRRGNNAVVICEELPELLIDGFFEQDWIKRSSDNFKVNYTLEDDNKAVYWQVDYVSNFKAYKYNYSVIDNRSIDKKYVDVEKITYAGEDAVMVKMDYGRGAIYFCSVPMIFSNYHLKTNKGKAHFDYFFDRFDGMDLVLDEASGYPFITEKIDYSNSDQEHHSNGSVMPDRSILEHVMENKPLFWTYALLLLMGLFYVVFKGKRKRSIVALQADDSNSSKEFITTVSELYLSKNQHRKLILQKKRVFLHHVRAKYFISGKEYSQEFIDALVAKSGVEAHVVTQIFNRFNQAEKSQTVSASELKDLHADIETFYKTCN